MAATPLAKHYEHLEPEERLTAVLSALARRDEAEATRLADACPRLTYTCGDRAFLDRLMLALDAAALAAADLQGLCARLDGYRWAAEAGRAVGSVHQIGAATAFLAGVRHGHAKAGGAGDPVGDEDDGWDARLNKPLADIDAQAGAALEVLPAIADRNAGGVARELAGVWAALGRFSKDRLGVPPDTLLAARGFRSLPDEMAAAVGRHPDVKPDPAEVTEYLGMLDVCWVARLGADEDHE